MKIPVDANHSEIAKFNKPGDPTYTTVLEYLRKFAEDAPSHIAQKFCMFIHYYRGSHTRALY